MSERSPTPWKFDADTRIETAYGSKTEHEVLAGWNVYDADGIEIIGCEGILADREHVAKALVHAVNLHDEMVEALRAFDDDLSHTWGSPDSYEAAFGMIPSRRECWRAARAVLSKSNPTQKGE